MDLLRIDALRRWQVRLLSAGLTASLLLAPTPSAALLPSSERVRKLIDQGCDALDKVEMREELGAACLTALALHKAGRKDHPRISEALAACRQATGSIAELDTYSHGLAIVYLAEVHGRRERELLRQYLTALAARQQPDGGWGYLPFGQGDTSQTQYVALALWQTHRAGIPVDAKLTRGMLRWLTHTQDPSGAWGYQGKYSADDKLQKQTGVSDTMAAAALASLMIGSDLHGLLNQVVMEAQGNLSTAALPPSVRLAGEETAVAPTLPREGVDWDRVSESIDEGVDYINVRPVKKPDRYACYYLYALERYHAFLEFRTGKPNPEPEWYEAGVRLLEQSQQGSGGWDAMCGPSCDTAFSILFLLRSTQKSLRAKIGEGSLVSGRGLPKNIAGARLSNGQVIVDVDPVGIGDFLSLMDQGESDRLDALAADPTALLVDQVSRSDAERLEQVLRTGEPEARRFAARALGRISSLDSSPALMFALTDPNRAVVVYARDALRSIARRPSGFGMPDDFTDDQRYEALQQWKTWYQALRPEAILDLGR